MNKHLLPLLLWLVVLHLVLPVVLPGSGAAAYGAPNLIPFKPDGWSDWLVVADTANTTTDSTSYTAGETLYVSWAVINWSVDPSGPFRIRVYIDGAPFKYWDAGGLNGGYYINLPGYPIGSLCAGSHTIKIVADSDNAVIEANETDNDYSKTITVTPGPPAVEACPVGHDFLNQDTAGRISKTFTFFSVGAGDLDIAGVSIIGVDVDDFTIITDGCSGQTLPTASCSESSNSCTVKVAFSPGSSGEKNALLSISSSDPDSPNLLLPLTGNGIAPPSLVDAINALQLVSGKTGATDLSISSGVDFDGKVGLEEAIYALQKIGDLIRPVEYELVKITTAFGNILIWLYDQTPAHRDNFVSLARQGFYDGLIFHRVIDGFMIQGGDPLGTGSGGPGYTLPAEIDCVFTHVQGAVAAARTSDSVNPEKRSSGSQFYIVENEAGAHFLDQNYTVFGQVISGMEAVVSIGGVQTDANDKPIADVVMTKVEVITLTADELADQYGFSATGQ